MDAYIHAFCLCLCYYDILSYMCVPTIYKYNCGAFWWAIYRILIGYLSDIYDRLLLYIIYTSKYVCAYRCIL